MSSVELDHHEAMSPAAGTQKRVGLGKVSAKFAAYTLDALITLGWAGFLVFVIFGFEARMLTETF